MVITGKIFDIVIINDNVAQIVIRKRLIENDKEYIVPVAITVWGKWKRIALEEQKLKPKDKIKGNVYMKSKKWKDKNGVDRYYTDVWFKDIVREEYEFKSSAPDLFVDQETGEILE